MEINFQGAALGTMAGFMTYGNKKYAPIDGEIRKLIPPLYEAMKDLLPLVDADALAFADYMVIFCYNLGFYLGYNKTV